MSRMEVDPHRLDSSSNWSLKSKVDWRSCVLQLMNEDGKTKEPSLSKTFKMEAIDDGS